MKHDEVEFKDGKISEKKLGKKIEKPSKHDDYDAHFFWLRYFEFFFYHLLWYTMGPLSYLIFLVIPNGFTLARNIHFCTKSINFYENLFIFLYLNICWWYFVLEIIDTKYV